MLKEVSTVPQLSPSTTSYHLLQVPIVPGCVGLSGVVRKVVCFAVDVEDAQAAEVVPTQ
jgi:hypothetical protein